MKKNILKVSQILKNFNFKIFKKATTDTEVTSPHIARIGTVFLVNKINNFPKNNVFVFGKIEKQFISSLPNNKK